MQADINLEHENSKVALSGNFSGKLSVSINHFTACKAIMACPYSFHEHTYLILKKSRCLHDARPVSISGRVKICPTIRSSYLQNLCNVLWRVEMIVGTYLIPSDATVIIKLKQVQS